MATETVEITPRGIRKGLNKYTPQRAIAEYIWNGFDAHAKEVKVKSPTDVPKLKMQHYTQINTYMNVIKKQDGFNDPTTFWTFLLIGLDIDDIAEQQIKNQMTGLCLEKDNYRLYMKTWAQVLNEAEARFNYLKEKMQNERDRLVNSNSLDSIMQQALNNTAVAEDVN